MKMGEKTWKNREFELLKELSKTNENTLFWMNIHEHDKTKVYFFSVGYNVVSREENCN